MQLIQTHLLIALGNCLRQIRQWLIRTRESLPPTLQFLLAVSVVWAGALSALYLIHVLVVYAYP